MINPAELAVQIENTRAFVAADYVEVVLERSLAVGNGAGGLRRTGWVPLAPQTARLVPGGAGAGEGVAEAVLLDGKQYTVAFTLVALPSFDILAEDEFDHEGGRYRVASVWRPGGYETKAKVVSRG